MKKSIIALAALAASGASFAQVTITGTLAMGYKATKATGVSALNAGIINTPAAGGADASGMGVDTSQINISAKEDLGGGQSIEAQMALAGLDRSGESGDGSVKGRDAILTYTNTSFGRVQLGTTEGAAVHSGVPTAGAPVIDMDGKLFQKKQNNDFISYAAPIGPLLFQYKLSESQNGLGLGQGSSGPAGTKVDQRTSDFALAYNQGALTLVGVYRSYDNREKNTIASPLGLTKDDVFGVQAGYDAGVAKFGFGYNTIGATVGPKVQDILVGVSAPVGAWTLGATYGMAITSGAADAPVSVFPGGSALFKSNMQKADGTATGYSLGAQYSMSKRTSVLMRYASWVRSGYEQFEAWGARAAAAKTALDPVAALNEFGYTDRASEASILLVHNF